MLKWPKKKFTLQKLKAVCFSLLKVSNNFSCLKRDVFLIVYKPALQAALYGGYVNFGVFGLDGDIALDDVLGSFVEILMSIPQSDLLVSKASIGINKIKVSKYYLCK